MAFCAFALAASAARLPTLKYPSGSATCKQQVAQNAAVMSSVLSCMAFCAFTLAASAADPEVAIRICYLQTHKS